VNAAGATVTIINIQNVGTRYSVDFTPSGYTPTQGGIHTHFYYNTEANSVMDKMFSGPSPYSLDTTTKPAGATQLCAIVAEANHAVIAGSGNCFDLPSSSQTSSSSSFSSQLSAVASVGAPTLGGYFGSAITGFLGGALPSIATTQSGLASGTVAYFTSGYNLPVVGTIQGQVFIPNQGQIIPLTATIGNATGTLSVNIAGQSSLKLTIPTNFSPAPVSVGGSITINTGGNNQNSSSNSSVVDYNYCLDQSGQKHMIQTKGAALQRSINIKGVGGGVGISNSSDSTNISCSDLGNLCLDISSEQYAIKTKHDTVKNSVGNIRREIANSSSNSTFKDFSVDFCEQFINELPANLSTTPAVKNAIKTKGDGKNITPVVSNTELVKFDDGTHLTIARKGWDGSIKGITAGDQLLIEEPCQGSFGQVALTFKKGINEGGLKLTEIDQNNLFPNLVGDLSNGCNMSITGFDKDDVSEARVYLGDDFVEKTRNPGGQVVGNSKSIKDVEDLVVQEIEKATSGLKDTLKTQVRLAAGPCKFPYLCGDEEDYALGLETDSGELFSFDSNNSAIPTIDSWSWGTSNPSTGTGGGMGAGKVRLLDLSFTASTKNYVGHVTLIKQRTDGDKKYIGTVTIVKKGEPNSSIDISQYQPILDVFQNTINVIEQAVGPCKPPYLCDFVSIEAKTGRVSLIKGKQTQGATFGERVNAGLQQAGGALANGVDSPTNSSRKFFRVVQNGRLVNQETGEFLQAQYSNSPWKNADIAIDENGDYYVSIPSAFKQFAITKGVLDYSIEKGSTIKLARTGGFSDISFGTRLVLFLILASFITIKTYEKN
jgi:hypothetical protein